MKITDREFVQDGLIIENCFFSLSQSAIRVKNCLFGEEPELRLWRHKKTDFYKWGQRKIGRDSSE